MQRLQVHTAATWRWTRRNGAKHAGSSFQQFCLPRRDVCRMHVMQLRQLRQRLLTVDRSQSYLRFEGRALVRRDLSTCSPPAMQYERRNQAGKLLIGLFRFAQPPLTTCQLSARIISRHIQ